MIDLHVKVDDNMPVMYVTATRGQKTSKEKFSGTKLDKSTRIYTKLRFEEILDLKYSIKHGQDIVFMRDDKNRMLRISLRQNENGRVDVVMSMNGVSVGCPVYRLLGFIDYALDVAKRYITLDTVVKENAVSDIKKPTPTQPKLFKEIVIEEDDSESDI